MSDVKLISDDTYQKMKSEDPIRYGEYLCKLQDAGLTQTQIANKLKTNRQLVGRYQKIGKWPQELKEFISKNRRYISNTAMLNATMSLKEDEQILTEFKNLIGIQPAAQELNAEIKTFPTLPPFLDLAKRIETIETHLALVATKKPLALFEEQAGKNFSINQLSWRDLINALITPGSVFTLICIISISAYLIHQSLLFFKLIDPNDYSAISSAVISEAIPIFSAACLALSAERLYKISSFIILISTIICLGFFMHASLGDKMTKQSGQFSRLTDQRQGTLSDIEDLSRTLSALPPSFFTKRQQLVQEIQKNRDRLGRIDVMLSKETLERSDVNQILFTYSVWIRVAAMLLNAIFVHFLFSKLRQRAEIYS